MYTQPVGRLPIDGALWSYLSALATGEVVLLDARDAPPWFEPGVICEVSEQTYSGFLELGQPRWMHGSIFVFGEGNAPQRIFWHRDERFFGRELTAREAGRFCQLCGISLNL